MGRTYSRQIVIRADADDVAQRAQHVLFDMPRVYLVEDHSDFVQAWVDTSMRSWGETIMVYISEVSGETVTEVESRCKFPLQIIDWGKNKDNVEHIIHELQAS